MIEKLRKKTKQKDTTAAKHGARASKGRDV